MYYQVHVLLFLNVLQHRLNDFRMFSCRRATIKVLRGTAEYLNQSTVTRDKVNAFWFLVFITEQYILEGIDARRLEHDHGSN